MQVKAKHIASRPSFAGLMQKDLFDMLGALGGPKDAFLPKRKAALNQQGAMQPEISEEEAGMAARPNGQNGAAAGAKSYNSRSGKIFGLLSEMSEEMQRDLAEAQKTEATSEENFANLKAAKEGEIAAATEQMKAKEAELADTLNKMAKAKRDLEKTEDALAADTDFLANMKKDCQVEDENYKKRSEIRSQEIVALAETLKILNADDARELFGKTISFVQESSSQKAALMDRASKRAMERIAEVARRHKNWALVSLAVRVRLDAFTKIKEMMDKMLAELKKQQQEEYEKKEACTKDIDETEDSIKEKNNLKDDLDEKHKSLKNTLETLKTEIAELQKEEEDMKIALKQSGEQRKAENQIYQQSVMDQRATVNILNKALARLKSFYESTGFIQQPGQAVSAPPPKGKDYSKSAGAGGVLQLLQKIITEAEQEEIELQGDENSAQVNYGKFVQDTTASIEADRKAIEEKTAQVAEAETALSETEEAQMANNAEISKLDDLLKAIHVDCDFTLKYFDIRQQARQEEMDSITDAKAILSGADFGK
jgi:chromosome segregation ATPase